MKRHITTIIFVTLALASVAQVRDSVIFRAMKDELTRNMNELRYEGFDKPFYIAYSIDDFTQYEVAASMGALLRSNDTRSRVKNIRVLVGDYDFNDESLDNNNFSAPEANEIQLPLDDDYYGIRRALWVTTDYVYKSAARQYKKNLETLKEKNKKAAEIPHRRFAKIPPQTIMKEARHYDFQAEKIQRLIRSVSDIFTSFPTIQYSTVYLSFYNGYNFFVNSEGTVSKTPVSLATLQIFAQVKTEDGESIYERIVHNGATPDELPDAAQLHAQVKELCARLTAQQIPSFEDEYSGPVLFVGEPVADIFAEALFSMRESLIAADMLPDTRGFKQDQLSPVEARLGKPFLQEFLTVRARPTLTTFNGTKLLGSYLIDDEGVVPEDVTLVDRGVLKTFLNNRSLIKDHEVANGHSAGPGVIEVTIENGAALKTLKEKLIAAAKKEGLDYALIVSNVPTGPGGGVSVTKVNVTDGTEQRVRGAMLQPVTTKMLRNLLGAGATSKAYNLQKAGQRLSSYIVPEAILVDELEARRADVRVFKEESYVANPLIK